MIPSRRAGARAAHALTATVLAGILTYVILAIVSRTVSATEFDQFSVFWSIALIVGFGVFLPVEQESARIGRDPLRAAALLPVMTRSTVLLVVVVGALTAAAVPVFTTVLGLTPALAWACVAVVLASGIQFAARGRMLAEGRAIAFTNTLIVDTLLRVGLFAAAGWAIVTLDPASPDAWFAAALVVAIVVAHAWAVPLRWTLVDHDLRRTYFRAVAILIATSMCAQLLVNAGPIVIQALSESPGLAGAFQASSTLARIPLAMITPIQAMLVGPLAALVVGGDVGAVATMMRRVAVAGLGLAVVGAVLGWLLGPWIVTLIFGPGRALPGADIALLVAGVVVHVVLIVVTQAVIAAGRHITALVAWAVALGVAVAVFLLALDPGGPVLGVELGFGVGSLAGAMVAFVALLRLARSGAGHPAPRTEG